ncbi:NO-inducible flavohemoprotein [Hyphomicrobium sp. D-2]|uniref:NO-inducible flavohemoprotein n=1 Tax=Hyphomicrobium sp. D-2 TaxID=3041621 RepID=UPI002457CA38|nr:NO-inducible flavohemoprotein [Hyphomicrobium sp. D-2]MDH4980662.1 NO-inducible flavohemoprotein [Hyphomicrobium sp. D-2]
MSKTVSTSTIALVKATVPALEAHGLDIVREMYSRMFRNPEIRDLFNQSHHDGVGAQPRALTGAILAYASNIDNLAVLGPAVERIAQKHVGLQILPEHYPHVADALLGAIKAVLGDAATDEILAAWGEAYWFLANILIERERNIYTEQKSADGGWNGWRDFRVEEIIEESQLIRSFVLRPADGGSIIRHKPGQYLTFWLDVPGHPPLKRNYSISNAPNSAVYRISVKREPQGLASGWLHDNAKPGTILKVSAPAGEFFLPENVERPVVLLSGGVGLTPMVSMLETLVERGSAVPVHYIHGTQNRATHAMRDHVRKLASNGTAVSITAFHEEPLTDEVQGHHYEQVGRVTDEWLLTNTPVDVADYFICGPRPFLHATVSTLAAAGVPASRIHYEFFGPADEVLAA